MIIDDNQPDDKSVSSTGRINLPKPVSFSTVLTCLTAVRAAAIARTCKVKFKGLKFN